MYDGVRFNPLLFPQFSFVSFRIAKHCRRNEIYRWLHLKRPAQLFPKLFVIKKKCFK